MAEPSIERAVPSGALILSMLVTDGHTTWLHTERYFDYTEEEARTLFAISVADHGWTAAP